MKGDARTGSGELYTASRVVSDRRNNEPEQDVNLARSLFVQPKHARDKSRGLTAEIQARIRHKTRGRDRPPFMRRRAIHAHRANHVPQAQIMTRSVYSYPVH